METLAPAKSPPRRRHRDEGQSVVEAAIVMPAMTFLILVLMQLTMIQHARIMTDYAAFCAARAGIVFNADKDAMETAATIALTPTMGRTDSLTSLTKTYVVDLNIERAKRFVFNRLPIVRVNTISPKKAAFAQGGRHLQGKELDFDDLRPNVAAANQLQIELTYLYKMRIPFANQMIQAIFFAHVQDMLKFWQGVNMVAPRGPGDMPIVNASRAAYVASGDPDAAGMVAASFAKLYYFPLHATYTMRMQSNPHAANAGN